MVPNTTVVGAILSSASDANDAITNKGTIKGQVRVAGKAPGNPIIRMGMDPMCSQMNAGKRVVQETVVASLDGSLANVFVSLQGSFPRTAVPTEPVTIDQRGCVYSPRVLGVRVGQSLLVRNGDPAVADAYCASRVAAECGLEYGTLPARCDFGRIIARGLPVAA